MAINLTSNGSTTFAGVNSSHVATVIVLGVWDSAALAVKIQDGNGTWRTHPTNGTKSADFCDDYRLGEQSGIQLVLSNAGASTDLQAQVTSYRP